MSSSQAPIGVFDSGMGGLTVLKALKAQLPYESFVYLGDTARLPYGTKSPETVIQYALKMTQILLEHRIKMLVVACNTASAAALPALRQYFPSLPIVGVIAPGANAAVAAAKNHHYALLATETTIQSGVYQQTLKSLDAQAQIQTQACGLFVALAEENCTSGPIAQAVVIQYLSPIIEHIHHEGCIILGCTHFPILESAIRAFIGPRMAMVDSTCATARTVRAFLRQEQLLALEGKASKMLFMVTDNPLRFQHVGAYFLGEPIKNVSLTESVRATSSTEVSA